MRRLMDLLVVGIRQHFKAKFERREREEITLKEVQTLAKKWLSRCAARPRCNPAPWSLQPRVQGGCNRM